MSTKRRFDAREHRDDVFDDIIGEILLLRVTRHVLERQDGDGAVHLPIGIIRQAHAARLTFALDPRSDVDTITKNVAVIDDDVANVYSHPELDARLIPLGQSFRNLLLNRDGGSGINGTRELDQHAVASGLDDTTPMGGDCGIDDLASARFQGRERADLDGAHQTGVTGSISRQTPLDALVGVKQLNNIRGGETQYLDTSWRSRSSSTPALEG
jgi:hypothetical protein